MCTGFRFFVTNIMALVTATVFLRTNLKPDSVASGNLCEHWLQHAAVCHVSTLPQDHADTHDGTWHLASLCCAADFGMIFFSMIM